MGKSRVEYADVQITVYNACPYGCRYCFWSTPLWRSRRMRIEPKPLAEAEKYAAYTRRQLRILISFVSDPYQPIEQTVMLTRRTLEILSCSHHRVMILTKNPRLALRDLDILSRMADAWLGSTVVTLSRGASQVLEPRAPPPVARLSSLERAHREGVHTWLSVEPVIPGVTRLDEIVERTHAYVDFYVIGAFNYARQLGFPQPTASEYLHAIERGLALLDEMGIPYLVKKELRAALGWEDGSE